MRAKSVVPFIGIVSAVMVAAALVATRADGWSSRVRGVAASSILGERPSPASTPPALALQGRLVQFLLASPAIGRATPVVVYLPASYRSHPRHRYPVLYLLHGSPGGAVGFVLLGIPAVEDVLIAEHRIQPMILVMPQGLRGTEWANDPRPHSAWEMFVARDLVRAVDSRFRTIPSASGRAIAGLSEGGYGALNIAIHHPAEFHVVESWSGYESAGPNVFRRIPRLIAYNSPAQRVRMAAEALRAARTYFWFYVGRADPLRPQNERFAAELRSLRIDSRFFEAVGQHNHLLWGAEAPLALTAAAMRLA